MRADSPVVLYTLQSDIVYRLRLTWPALLDGINPEALANLGDSQVGEHAWIVSKVVDPA